MRASPGRGRGRRWVVFALVVATGAAAIEPESARRLSGSIGHLPISWRGGDRDAELAWDAGALLLRAVPPAAPVVPPTAEEPAPAPPVFSDSVPAIRVVSGVATEPAAPAAVALTSGSRGGTRRAAPRPSDGSTVPVPWAAPGRLFVSSDPWGLLYLDERLTGNTPRVDQPVAPGRHRIRIVRPGYEAFDTTVTIQPGVATRLTGITLRGKPT